MSTLRPSTASLSPFWKTHLVPPDARAGLVLGKVVRVRAHEHAVIPQEECLQVRDEGQGSFCLRENLELDGHFITVCGIADLRGREVINARQLRSDVRNHPHAVMVLCLFLWWHRVPLKPLAYRSVTSQML